MSAETDQRVFLGREGKYFGPFSTEEVEELKKNGLYLQYSWLWEGSATGWVAINPPPHPPDLKRLDTGLDVVCRDKHSWVGGRLIAFDRSGFQFEARVGAGVSSSGLPPFRKGTKVSLNLLDDATGRAENIEAVVKGSIREGEIWKFEMSWARVPGLISELSST